MTSDYDEVGQVKVDLKDLVTVLASEQASLLQSVNFDFVLQIVAHWVLIHFRPPQSEQKGVARLRPGNIPLVADDGCQATEFKFYNPISAWQTFDVSKVLFIIRAIADIPSNTPYITFLSIPFPVIQGWQANTCSVHALFVCSKVFSLRLYIKPGPGSKRYPYYDQLECSVYLYPSQCFGIRFTMKLSHEPVLRYVLMPLSLTLARILKECHINSLLFELSTEGPHPYWSQGAEDLLDVVANMLSTTSTLQKLTVGLEGMCVWFQVGKPKETKCYIFKFLNECHAMFFKSLEPLNQETMIKRIMMKVSSMLERNNSLKHVNFFPSIIQAMTPQLSTI